MVRFKPRLTFSLRTLFVVLTAICLALGWQWRTIHERRAVVSWLREHASCNAVLMGSPRKSPVLCAYYSPDPPWFRRMLGARPMPGGFWVFKESLQASDLARIQRAFPEFPVNERYVERAFIARENAAASR